MFDCFGKSNEPPSATPNKANGGAPVNGHHGKQQQGVPPALQPQKQTSSAEQQVDLPAPHTAATTAAAAAPTTTVPHAEAQQAAAQHGDKAAALVASPTAQAAKVDPTRIAVCPLGHGSVGVGPYPGYVHGTHPVICKYGCKPDPTLGKERREGETWRETLIREALEYQVIYHMERNNSAEVAEKRKAEVLDEIERTGTYTHTFDELEYGGRLAWRNAPKCSNRKFWEELQLMDYRHLSPLTGKAMHAACLELLERATLSSVTTTNIAVFRPQTPGTDDGPRFWSTQLLRFACYTMPDGTLMGDPAQKEFCEMLQAKFGWQPPPVEQRTPFDVMPIVLQPDVSKPPEIFKVPEQYALVLPICHPDFPAFSALGLKWFAIPAVTALEMTIGGLLYTAIPFNGWFSVTEIVRNLTDAARYDVCKAVAHALGVETKAETNLWRDRAITEVAVATIHSFRDAGLGIVDHHTLMKNFYIWYNNEVATRGYSPGNWKWIIPPLSPTASRCYMELGKMTEYTLKPGYWAAPGWKKYLKRLEGAGEGAAGAAASAHGAGGGAAAAEAGAAADGSSDGVACRLLLIYATVTGVTLSFAEAVVNCLRHARSVSVTLVSVDDFEVDGWTEMISRATLVVVMTSTYGPGTPPLAASKVLAAIQAKGSTLAAALRGKPYAVLGFGNRNYPRFCAAATTVDTVMQSAGAKQLLTVAKADELSHQELAVWGWVQDLMQVMVTRELISQAEATKVLDAIPISSDGICHKFVPRFVLIDLAGTEGLQAARDHKRQSMVVKAASELLQKPEGPATSRLVQFDTTGTLAAYLPGDAVCIYGENCDAAVHAVAEGLGIREIHAMFLLQPAVQKGDEGGAFVDVKPPFPLPNTYDTILRKYVALDDLVSFEAVSVLAQYAPKDKILSALAAEYEVYRSWRSAEHIRWRDIFATFPSLCGGALPGAVFFQLAPQIKARHYSIASSRRATPDELAVTVGQLNYKLSGNGQERVGFCSSYLCTRKPGDRVAFKISSTAAFRMPLDRQTPVIMVAAGTGIAPFRSFWDERLARKVGALADGDTEPMGPGVIIYGCRSSDSDYLYRDTLKERMDQNVLSHVLPAFSREPGVRKTYVQDLILQKANDLKVLLAHPRCHIFVCGSSNMAQEVATSFGKLMGADALSSLVDDGRYHEDLFGIKVVEDSATAKVSAQLGMLKELTRQAAPNAAGALLAKDLSVKRDEAAALRAQLDGGLDVNILDEDSNTLLHGACAAGRMAMVELLVERGAALEIMDVYGQTPAQKAHLAGHDSVVAFLATHNALRVPLLYKKFYPLQAMAMENDVEGLKAVAAKGANLSHRDYLGLTPLFAAVSHGRLEAVQYLLAAGVSPRVPNNRGNMVLQVAIQSKRDAIVAALKAFDGSLESEMVGGRMTTAGGLLGAEAASATSAAELKAAGGMTTEEVLALQGAVNFLSGGALMPEKVKQQLEDLGFELFTYLFDQSPVVLKLFPFKDGDGKPIVAEMRKHGLTVVLALATLVEKLNNFGALYRWLVDLIERHLAYGVQMEHYPMVVHALVGTLQHALGDNFDALQASAWTKLVTMLGAVAASVYASKAAPRDGAAPKPSQWQKLRAAYSASKAATASKAAAAEDAANKTVPVDAAAAISPADAATTISS